MREINFEELKKIYDVEKIFHWREWLKQIPYLQFPPHYKVKAVPPFAGALIRYWIRTDEMHEDDNVSIYLDAYDMIGFVGKPYWEVYDGHDCERCLMANTERLMQIIEEAIKTKTKEKKDVVT